MPVMVPMSTPTTNAIINSIIIELRHIKGINYYLNIQIINKQGYIH